MRHSTEPFAQHYSEREHPVRGPVDTKLHSQQGRKEEPSVTAPVTVMSGRRAQPRLRLQQTQGTERLGRLCRAGASATRTAQLLARALSPAPGSLRRNSPAA